MSSSINNPQGWSLLPPSSPPTLRDPSRLIDNQAVVEGFNRIKDRRDKPTRWISKPDGDPWQFWEKAIITGGVETRNVKWIPGHQTKQDEDNGKISKYDRRGNAVADELARYASQNHNEGMAMYAQETVRRNDKYRKLVHRIHKHMLRVINRLRLGSRHPRP